MVNSQQIDVFLLEDLVWIAAAKTGLLSYDFAFELYFACRHPWQRPDRINAVGRFGVTADYPKLYSQFESEGIQLIHSPQQHDLASELTEWYPRLQGLTPRSVWFDQPPSSNEITEHFDWPVFLKGSRQTSRHRAELSIIRSAASYNQAIALYTADPILRWQPLVCREYVSLRPVNGSTGDKVPAAFEFRTFWWNGRCVGAGPYWAEFASYGWTKLEEVAALSVAGEAARRMDLPFLVVDVAQTADGRWLVIECNDGQESGYAGISPLGLWQSVIDIERQRLADPP
jgi:hypothetical protein